MTKWWMVLVVVTGCVDGHIARVEPEQVWAAPPQAPSPDAYPDAPAVIVSRTIRITNDVRFAAQSSAPYLEEHHDVLAILRETGLRYRKLVVPPNGRAGLRVRVVSPTGEIHEVTSKEAPQLDITAATVGSLIDYRYAIRKTGGIVSATSSLGDELPIAHERVELRLSDNLVVELKAYNTDARWKRELQLEGVHATLDLVDIPAVKSDRFAVPRALVEPSWALRLLEVDHARTTQTYGTWREALKHESERLYAKPKRPVEVPSNQACASDLRCTIGLALGAVRDRADPIDRVTALHAALATLGIPSRFALVAHDPSRAPDESFPMPRRYDRIVLVVGKEAIWVDPTCDACKVGQLSNAIANRRGMILAEPARVGFVPGTEVTFADVHGDPPLVDQENRTTEVRIGDDGSLDGTLVVDEIGTAAEAAWSRAHLPTVPVAAPDVTIPGRESSIRSQVMQACDPATATCSTRAAFSIAGYATMSPRSIIVPLAYMRSKWDLLLVDDTRRGEIFVERPEHADETLRILLPKGARSASVPERTWHSSVMDVKLTVEARPDAVIVHRIIDVHAGRFPESDYPALVAAFRGLLEARRVNVVLAR